jgi:hypothetical protein
MNFDSDMTKILQIVCLPDFTEASFAENIQWDVSIVKLLVIVKDEKVLVQTGIA